MNSFENSLCNGYKPIFSEIKDFNCHAFNFMAISMHGECKIFLLITYKKIVRKKSFQYLGKGKQFWKG